MPKIYLHENKRKILFLKCTCKELYDAESDRL